MTRTNLIESIAGRWPWMTLLLVAACADPTPPGAQAPTTSGASEASDVGSGTANSADASSTAASSATEVSSEGGSSAGGPIDMGTGDASPAWREGQTPFTWRLVGTSVAEDVDPEDDPALNPNHPDPAPWRNSSGGGDIFRVWSAWSGATWDESTGILRVHGGGHDDYAGNEVYAQRLIDDAPLWWLERAPTGAVGNTGVLDDLQELTAVYFDDRPRSNHSYDNLLSIDGEMWLAIVAAPYRAGGGTGLRTFKLVAGDWETVQAGQFPAGGAGAGGAGSACHDTARHRIYYWPSQNSAVSYWDIDAGAATTLSLITNAGRQSRAIYIPEQDVQVVLNGSYDAQFGIYDYDRTPSDAPLQPGAKGIPPSYPYDAGWWYPNGVWVPGFGDGDGAILCWHGGSGLWALTPPASGDPATTAWRWSQVAADASNEVDPGLPSSNGVYGRFFYSARLGGVGLSQNADEPTYFMALE